MVHAIGLAVALALAPGADPAGLPFVTPASDMLPAAATTGAGDASAAPVTEFGGSCCGESRGFLESDHAFDRFIGPITNPFYAKDPRSLTELRFVFVNDVIPATNLLGGGDFQVYGVQARAAVTDRLSIFMDKAGYATFQPHATGNRNGWLDTAVGFKYDVIRDVEKQRLFAVGAMYELPSGEADVFQHNGAGILTLFSSSGQEFWCNWHIVNNTGVNIPMNNAYNSGVIYSSMHIDRRCFGWLYPLAEVNWFYYYAGGSHGVPSALGEGDGLFNFGTNDMSGSNFVSAAFGLKAVVSDHLSLGAAWEFPLTNRHDVMDNRLTAEVIFRY
jgi:hypothetical protein